MDISHFFSTAGGLVVGIIIALFWRASERAQRFELEKRASLAEGLMEQLKNREIPGLEERLRDQESTITELRTEGQKLHASLTETRTVVEKERQAALEKQQLLAANQRQLTETFNALSSDALRKNNESFLELARETMSVFQSEAKGDLEKRQQAIKELVKPVGESLSRFDSKVQGIEKDRTESYSRLTEQIRQLLESEHALKSETHNLVTALRAPQVRGRWGEIQLRRVVELAGMVNHCDFYEQPSVATDDGRLRPDLIVRLPNNRTIVIDAKAPLEGYLKALETTDAAEAVAHLDAHARHIRDHIAALSRKAYHEQFTEAPEFVVLFLPGESFFSAALERDPSLIEKGVEDRIILATPTTLISLLKAVSYGWRQETLAENAREISALGRELYDRIATMAGHLRDVGSRLDNAVTSYNRAMASLETRVLVSARKFKALKASEGAHQIPAPEPVDTISRRLQSQELTGEEDESFAAGPGDELETTV